ncbi:pilus assembly protein [Qipengyuania aurantiaca]|uniref:Pilus assembly protein n=1 Tax=Qipengyuania aurantiaca TaxID=2867233 RepID=A0ABX8ZTW0_9SPHN|nr:TadE/TadG family type IV pilus assembly protein [Qipengyuania aurantiaca]QZD90588.1 pilus assembly protein [Qipengyuania aurantiaca]
MSSLSAFLRDTRGAAATEMALMVPLLLVLMFAGFEAGHYFYTEQKIIKAVREGARYAGRLGFSNYPCGGTIDSTAVAQVQQVTRTGTISGQTARVPNLALADISVSHRCDDSYEDLGIFRGTNGGAPIVLVQASTNYNSLFEALGLIDSSVKVQASAEAVVNGI